MTEPQEEEPVIEADSGKVVEVDESNSTENTASKSTDLQNRLFQLRMKINQGRKANKAEVEEEYKRLSTSRKAKKKGGDDDEEDGSSNDKVKNKKKDEKDVLNQTAEEAEWEAQQKQKKQEIAHTYGYSAFASDRSYRAYEKRVNKLAEQNVKNQQKASKETSALTVNPFDYGKVNSGATPEALERLKQDVLTQQEQRDKFHKKRASDTADIDYINDKNARFNKKLKNAFDKYTLEIRQNLERGTAV